MKVKLITRACGASCTGGPGDVVNVSDECGADLIEGGYAEAVAVKAEPVKKPGKTDGPKAKDSGSSSSPKRARRKKAVKSAKR